MTRYMICTPTADILGNTDTPNVISNNDSQLLFGECFVGEAHGDDWIKGKSDIDGYSGYVHKKQLIPETEKPTHIIDVRLSHIYSAPDFKTPPLMPLSFLSRVHVDESLEQNGFSYLPAFDGWVFTAHLSAFGAQPTGSDIVETALLYLDSPYLYGGRSSLGIDCSGLVQNALLRHGIDCPRDSKDQENHLKTNTSADNLKRGDLVFFEGHVGIMVDNSNILNATARHMRTLVEPLTNIIDVYGGITGIAFLP